MTFLWLEEHRMDAFESLIAMLLRQKGYWVTQNYKIDLTKVEKRQIGRPSTPRWELDLVAHKGQTNKVLVVECKSFLDSPGVTFREGTFHTKSQYKLFTEAGLWEVIRGALERQLQEAGSCAASPTTTLCLVAGHIATSSDRPAMESYFAANGWRLFGPEWVKAQLTQASQRSYEDDIASVASKILLRRHSKGHGAKSIVEGIAA
jgi:hypothetical protein